MKMEKQILEVLLLYFTLKASATQLRAPLGEMLSLPCAYDFEKNGSIRELSVQWSSPSGQLLCHLIKHKSYRNCSAGYAVHYSPGNITLSIAEVCRQDLGKHLCSVSKLHEFSDFSFQLQQSRDASAEIPKGKVGQSGSSTDLLFFLGCSLFVMTFGS